MGATGLPKNYVAPKTVTTDMMTRLTKDQQFVNSLFYLENTQTNEPCTKQEQLNHVIRQDPPAGNLINGLTSKVKLVVCNLVLSPNKYLTAMYASPTPTATATLRSTNTPAPTATGTPTITVVPTNTGLPAATDTSGPTSTSGATSTTTATTAPTSAATSTSAFTDTSVPTATNTAGPSPTATITPTPTPRIDDVFISPFSGYDPTLWAPTLTSASTPPPAPTISWPFENLYQQEFSASNTHPGNYALTSRQACLFGQAEFRLRLSSSSSAASPVPAAGVNLITIGWEDTTGTNGIYLTAPELVSGQIDTSYVHFTTLYQGTAFTYPDPTTPALNSPNIRLNSSANGTFFTGIITWNATDTNYTGETDLYLNGSNTPTAIIKDDISSAIFKVPTKKMKFIIRNTTNGVDASWVEVDYVRITSNNFQ